MTYLALVTLLSSCERPATTLTRGVTLAMLRAVWMAPAVLAADSCREVEEPWKTLVTGSAHRVGETLTLTGSWVTGLGLGTLGAAAAFGTTLGRK